MLRRVYEIPFVDFKQSVSEIYSGKEGFFKTINTQLSTDW